MGRGQPPAVARVLERVAASARKHRMFPAGEQVLVACSGGPDSTCLLHALYHLRRLLRLDLAVFHFDHGLREDSAKDARYVERQAGRLALPFILEVAADAPRRGQSVEAWARLARYAALTRAATEVGAARAALGHTMDDQAETVLLGLARGGGLEAVAGMPPVTSVPPLGLAAVRPLLETSRAEVRAFCRAVGLRPRQDPTNRDPRFLRNRLRLDLIPLLEERLGRSLSVTLARTAEHVREDAAFLEALASGAAASMVTVGEQDVRVDAASLAGLPGPIAARVVRQALRLAAALGGEWEQDAGDAHIRGVIDLAGGRSGRRIDLPGELMAGRVKGYVRISRASPERPSRKGEA